MRLLSSRVFARAEELHQQISGESDTDPNADGARWLHPAHTSSCSATIRYGCLFVYSTSTEFETTESGAPNGYTKFRAYALLEHHGDLSLAARALSGQGRRQMHDANIEPLLEDVFDGGPIPLHSTVEMPEFPVDSLPMSIAAMVRGISQATQTDLAMPGTSALSALSACTGGHAEIEIRAGWRKPLCLYAVTIAASGERKSAVQLPMVRPILDVESQLAEDGLAARLEAETRKQVALKAADRQRNAAAAAGTNGQDATMANAIGAAMLAESIEVPPIPRMVADDITPEAAASLLADQGGRLAIISAEGGIFDIIAGRYSGNVPNMDLWLKGHSGDPLKVDRKGRAPEYVRRPALTLGLMIQPEVLNAIAANRQFRGRGFLARILYAWPVSKVGARSRSRPSIPTFRRTTTPLSAVSHPEWHSGAATPPS